MRFQSFIAAMIPRPIRVASSVLLLACVCSTSGCVMGLIAKKRTYDPEASSPPVMVNGAKVRLQLKPQGADRGSFSLNLMVAGAAVATLDGPFSWRIEAVDETGGLEYLVVHRLRTRTEKTKRDEWYPREHLGKRADFTTSKKHPGAARAIYDIPGRLEVKPREDGGLTIDADISIVGHKKAVRKVVRFRLVPVERRGDQFIFIPTEIVKSIGQTPEDWRDEGWE